MTDSGSYADAVAESRRLLAAGRLADPEEHYPYKRDAAQDAIDADEPLKMWTWDPRRGLTPSDETTAAVLTADLADATEAYIAAQAAYVEDPTAGDGEYKATRDRLVAARRAHRAGRDTAGMIADEVRF